MSNTAELIKDKIRISDFIRRYITLKPKANGQFVGLCPFHHEKTPSFTVSESKSFYHCFGCGESGDIFTFLMKMERLEYIDALKQLASQAGVELDTKNYQKADANKKCYEIYQDTANYYHRQLKSNSNDSNAALRYLHGRGFNNDIIQSFMIGLSPGYQALPQALLGKYKEQELLDSRVINKKNNLYDVFAERIIFPIQDRRGRVIAFGGRILKPSETAPKYLNSSDNPIFKKTYNLYGIYQANKHIVKSQSAIVVEGYLDVISLHQRGINNAVAPLGTSLKLEHLSILAKICNEVVICLDGDNAGARAMMRFVELALPDLGTDIKIRFISLPQGQDPDDYIKRHGASSFKNMIANARNLADFLFDYLYNNHDFSTPEGKASFKKSLEEYAAKINNQDLSREYSYYFKNKLWQKVQDQRKNKHKISANVAEVKKIPAFEEMLSLIIAHPKLLKRQDITTMLIEAEVSNKDIDRVRCNLLQLSDSINIEKDEESDLEIDIDAKLTEQGCNLEDMRPFIAKYRASSIEFNQIADKISLKYQLYLVLSDIKMLKQKLSISNDDNDLKRYNALITLREQLKQKINL